MDISHNTAMKRKKPSAPCRWLMQQGLLVGSVLDYGCGYGFDADSVGAHKYDLNFHPDMPDGPFDTIMCFYVLNVVESELSRVGILLDIQNNLTPDGCAYVAVRSDRAELKGRTSRGAWQGYITIPGLSYSNQGHFRLYRLFRNSEITGCPAYILTETA